MGHGDGPAPPHWVLFCGSGLLGRLGGQDGFRFRLMRWAGGESGLLSLTSDPRLQL